MAGNVAELRELPDEELLSRLEGLKEELFNLRFQLATSQLDNPMRIKQVRHDVARILTLLRERHLEAELEAEVNRAEEESLERGREAIASGEAKGERLDEMISTSMPEEHEGGVEESIRDLGEARRSMGGEADE